MVNGKSGKKRDDGSYDQSLVSLFLLILCLAGIVMIVIGFLTSRVNPSALIYIGIIALISGIFLSFLDVRGKLFKIIVKLRR